LRADLPKSSIVIQNSFDYESMSLLFNKTDKKKKEKEAASQRPYNAQEIKQKSYALQQTNRKNG
jgi:hypothetical protein